MNIKGQEMKTYQFFVVTIGNTKITENRVSPKITSAKISPRVI